MARKHREIRLKVLQGKLGDVAYELTHLHLSHPFLPHGWQPAINMYHCGGTVKICVDLAGVDRSRIDLRIDGGKLRLRGERVLPEPPPAERPCKQILAMEIDHGPFEREIVMPGNVIESKVTAQQRQGFLWITLPLESREAHGCA